MNAIVERVRLAAGRIGWRKGAIFGAAIVVAVFAAYWALTRVAFRDENRPAGDEIVAALEAYKAANKRYPEKLAQLQPKFLGKVPKPAPGTNFVYGISYDGTSAWFGYQTMGEAFMEFDSQARKWESLENHDSSQALRARTKEFVMGPK